MIERIILLSGPIFCGKSTLASRLAQQFNMSILKTREVLQRRITEELAKNRIILQNRGDNLDKRTRCKWVCDALEEQLSNSTSSSIIVDSVRREEQISVIREAYGPLVIHIHLTAPLDVLEERYNERHKLGKESTHSYAEARENATERQIETLSTIADVVIDTKRCTKEDVLVRAASHIKAYKGQATGFVDVLVGGQYGSEGKGQIAAYLAKEYDLLVRVGGPNAGHKVYEEPEPYPHHQLPSGTRRCEAQLLIGPGAVLNVSKLFKEIAECGVSADRLCIDRQAMIICDEDCDNEEGLKRGIGSTGQGVGAATARRITERHKFPRLARDVLELNPFLGNAIEILTDIFSRNGRIFLEGTQGAGLSLYHGFYPHVTSRDTTVAGCLAEAGISPNRVRKVIMVCRTYPIRVGNPRDGTSGWMSQPITWKEISKRSGKDLKEILKTEKTTTTHRRRRVGEFDWDLLRRSALLNGPTDIALTFTDYLAKENGNAKRFEQLHPETINFIQEVERVTGARVSLISTGFNPRSIIDRRSW